MVSVRFSCSGCGLKDELVEVLPRLKDQDMVWWMRNQVGTAVALKHAMLSPFCRSTTMDNVVVPLGDKDDADAWIGKDTEVIPPEGLADRRE